MILKLDDRFVRPFITDGELNAALPGVRNAVDLIRNANGRGHEMLGWLDLPAAYDREEYSRIKAAAEKIRKTCDVFIVIGIGGSYLGSRAVIEFIRSPRYNLLKKDTPDIYFSGCNISSGDLRELLDICEGKDVCINVISKSGTTMEPAVAFRCFRRFLEDRYGK